MYQLKINSKQKRFDVSKDLYGLFIEDINRAGDSYEDTNSFEEPERIIPKEQRIHILDKTVTLQPRTVNVIRLGTRN